MLFYLFIILCNIFLNQAAILKCDFETACNDFNTDSNWGLTDGAHPQSMNHDHTLNTSLGHYIFYDPSSGSSFKIAEIKTNDWLSLSTDRAVCFRMWYYTPRISLPFNIQLVQGDDEQLTRVAASIPGKDPSSNDWALINVILPSEKFKIFIRLNNTGRPLVFDDISVDYCDEPHPTPTKILYECDFESSCSEDFVSLPAYPYQWSILKASDAIKIENKAPSVDYTFGNQSGHYALLPISKVVGAGNVGYLHLQTELNITTEESYCLNFQYYGYGQSFYSNLKVYLRMSDESEAVQTIWPSKPSQYSYTRGKWTWGITNLPVGQYSLLFRMDTSDNTQLSFALDNISITSCAYPPYEPSPYYSILSFSCNFDNLTMCDMTNGDRISPPPTFNFTVMTGETIPNRELGPTRDHTSNSTTGGFLYWNQQLPFTSKDVGRVHPSTTIEQNFGMCIKFAYYVKSLAVNKNGTQVSISAGGCYGAYLWMQALDDSQGWQTVIIPVLKFACGETFYFDVYQSLPIAVSVAFDDIEIDQCSYLIPTTTTSTTTTTTTSTTITTTKTTTTSLTSSSPTTQSSMSSTISTTTTTTSMPTTTSSSNAYRLSSLNTYSLIIIYFLSQIFRNLF
ncbi:unnamed protein product [Adineta steineri]|uniref:MAM domain-containing protein n=1 Tax=Adineta steineri TaxID=433720 RepID=A0A819CKF2_9BILA|nr:unnamed protein product [Adineta steineri]